MNIGVRLVGTSPHKRYMIVRASAGVEEYWNGDRWSLTNGLLYHGEQDMARAYERLQMEQVSHMPERVFMAPVVIRVRSGQDFTLKQLEEYLFAAARLHLDHDNGKGPVSGSVVFLDIEWNEAKETTPEGGEPENHERQTQ